LRPEAFAVLAGSSLILHAGDVGDPAILTALEWIAPVRAVCGNTDHGELRWLLNETEVVRAAMRRGQSADAAADGVRRAICDGRVRPRGDAVGPPTRPGSEPTTRDAAPQDTQRR
jgi:predicted phosphodiesterase